MLEEIEEGTGTKQTLRHHGGKGERILNCESHISRVFHQILCHQRWWMEEKVKDESFTSPDFVRVLKHADGRQI
jgi:hypothetical protein